MMTLEQQFRSRVSAFLERTRLSPTRFGRMAMGDPGLVRQIEGGRSLTLRTADRILAFVDTYDGQVGRRARPSVRSSIPEAPAASGKNEEE